MDKKLDFNTVADTGLGPHVVRYELMDLQDSLGNIGNQNESDNFYWNASNSAAIEFIEKNPDSRWVIIERGNPFGGKF